MNFMLIYLAAISILPVRRFYNIPNICMGKGEEYLFGLAK